MRSETMFSQIKVTYCRLRVLGRSSGINEVHSCLFEIPSKEVCSKLDFSFVPHQLMCIAEVMCQHVLQSVIRVRFSHDILVFRVPFQQDYFFHCNQWNHAATAPSKHHRFGLQKAEDSNR